MEEFATALEDRKEENEEDDTAAAPRRRRILPPRTPATISNWNEPKSSYPKSKGRTVESAELSRKLTAVHGVADSAVRHKEEARSTRMRLERVLAEQAKSRKEREESRVVESRWTGFREDIVKAFGCFDNVGEGDPPCVIVG